MCLAFVVVLLLIMIASSFLRKVQAQHGQLPPGPMPLPVLGSLLSLRNPLHRHFASLTKIYGPIIHIKLGLVSYIVVNSSEMAREVLRAHDVEFAYRPLSKFGEYFSFGWKDVVLAPYGESWKNLKMITARHLLNPSRLDAAAAYQESEMALVVKDIGRLATASKVINLKHFIGKFVSGAFCQVLFGKRDVPVVDLISLIEKQTLSINVGKFIPPLDCLDLHGVNRRMRDDLMPKRC
ncbi:cytochrome P450 750A1-like [Selaginella moellendorffii]|uniref:cytochrome P450 750A1-like n=1 Tax=Selaginella moellendorffii TaxID=88036 RepID=UPI000D1C57FF|nr:cytochrome P450 750A1-like [Selaginella moellendorffii]|eukprot:XP_024536200.1 cytochrome P450 750A1-like [Selaginella moellendorffii]